MKIAAMRWLKVQGLWLFSKEWEFLQTRRPAATEQRARKPGSVQRSFQMKHQMETSTCLRESPRQRIFSEESE